MLRAAVRPLRASAFSSSSKVQQWRLASSLVFLEHKGGKLNDSSLSAVTAAKTLGDTAGIVIGSKADVDGVVGEAKKIEGLSKIYTASSDLYAHTIAEAVAPLLADFLPSKSITHLFGAHTAVGKNVFPRVGGILDTSVIADIIALESSGDIFTRPIYAGNAILKVKSSDKDKIKIVTVRTTAFDKTPIGSGDAPVEEVAEISSDSPTKYVSEELTVSSRPDLSSASRVVSGGRGLKSLENFNTVLDPLADALGAAVGASRAAVDSGYADNSLQVGQTGKVVAPELYVAVGISGAIQHLAGMKESKMIVAINKDADAPIFQVADVGLVADLFEAVPELANKVQAAKA
ncbi:DHS-like NAD/FAD-binding domain-containing protein [Naematelia encephala]|uniref:Probable electron transfer flavoprotein subunit alpha n=1 Tax=Naematelia encephala TaxID=71784 RepID=A0A1Y2AWC6_9TREE|nr:DHS-like NAD/FAD-binding domain-containing protein [Naematelia encephala]